MPKTQLTNTIHKCVYLCVKGDRVNVARSSQRLTWGMRLCDKSIISEEEDRRKDDKNACCLRGLWAKVSGEETGKWRNNVRLEQNPVIKRAHWCRVHVWVHACVCVQPCLQGEVEADALAAGLARLSGPNLQRSKRRRRRRRHRETYTERQTVGK